MEFCDFTGDSDFDFFIPTTTFSEQSLASNDSYTHLFFGHHKTRSRRPKQDNCRGCKGHGANDCEHSTWNNDAFDMVYPRARCAGTETSVSDQFPPTYPRVPTPNPFSFLHERVKTAKKSAIEARLTTTVVNTNECCQHEPQSHSKSRKFLMTFDKSSMAAAQDRSDTCYRAERTRCKEFWDFILTTPELVNTIREGKFVHKVLPRSVDSCGEPLENVVKSKKIGDQRAVKYEPEMEALRQRNIQIHQEEKIRREKLRNRLKKIEAKSGQKQISFVSEKEEHHRYESLADSHNPSPDEVLDEMEMFDVISNNPVQSSKRQRFLKRSRLCKRNWMSMSIDDMDAGECGGDYLLKKEEIEEE